MYKMWQSKPQGHGIPNTVFSDNGPQFEFLETLVLSNHDYSDFHFSYKKGCNERSP